MVAIGDDTGEQIPHLRHAHAAPDGRIRVPHGTSTQSYCLVCASSPTEQRSLHDGRRQRRLQPLQVPLPEEPHHHGQGQRAHGRDGLGGAIEFESDLVAAAGQHGLVAGQGRTRRAQLPGPDAASLHRHQAQQVLIPFPLLPCPLLPCPWP